MTFEVAHGYAPGEGLWYGTESGIQQMSEAEAIAAEQELLSNRAQQAPPPRKPKRSFSFGRKPKA